MAGITLDRVTKAFGAVVLGLVAAGSVGLLGLILSRYRRGEVVA